MNSQFKKGALELIVLLIIKRDDQYGYSLVQNISRHMSIAEGTVYPLLRRLVKNGELTTYYQPSSEGPARKYYKVTDQGNDRLVDLLHEWQSFSNIVEVFIKESERND
ncbi:PadR family transcriptional regulator [Staphylococcus cohnii]